MLRTGCTDDVDGAGGPGGTGTPPGGVTDEQLMTDACAGSVAAFESLHERYVHRADRIALSICRDRGLAQEAVQDAFLSAWQARASFAASRGSVAGWLLTIVRYRAIDLVRRRGREVTQPTGSDTLHPTSPSEPVDELVLRREAHRQLLACLDLLPPMQQEVITLAFFGQLSHTEIADALDLPMATVKGRVRLGMDKLRFTVERP